MKIGAVNSQIFTLVMLDVLWSTLLPSFHQIQLKYCIYWQESRAKNSVY